MREFMDEEEGMDKLFEKGQSYDEEEIGAAKIKESSIKSDP